MFRMWNALFTCNIEIGKQTQKIALWSKIHIEVCFGKKLFPLRSVWSNVYFESNFETTPFSQCVVRALNVWTWKAMWHSLIRRSCFDYDLPSQFLWCQIFIQRKQNRRVYDFVTAIIQSDTLQLARWWMPQFKPTNFELECSWVKRELMLAWIQLLHVPWIDWPRLWN